VYSVVKVIYMFAPSQISVYVSVPKRLHDTHTHHAVTTSVYGRKDHPEQPAQLQPTECPAGAQAAHTQVEG